MGNKGDVAVNYDSDAMSPHLDESRRELAKREWNGLRRIHGMGQGFTVQY